MKVYTYSEARQNLSALLDTAQKDGAVEIRRGDGSAFVLRPDFSAMSPMDVKPVPIDITTDEIVEIIRESRGRLD